MSNLTRRLLLRGLPMAPAMAKQVSGEIIKQAAAQAALVLDGPPTGLAGRGVPGESPISNQWHKIRKWTVGKLARGEMPAHKKREITRYARSRARWSENMDIEALGSISSGARRRMHEAYCFRKIICDEIEDSEIDSLYDALMEKAEKGLLG